MSVKVNIESTKKIIQDIIAKEKQKESVDPDEFQTMKESLNLTVATILKEYENSGFCIDTSRSLPALIMHFDSKGYYIASFIFTYIEEELEQKLKKLFVTKRLRRNILKCIEDLKERANHYYRKIVYKNMQNALDEPIDIADVLFYVTDSLSKFSPDGNKYYITALIDIKREMEDLVRGIKELNANRKAIAIDPELDTKVETENSKNPKFTTTRQVLAIRYLLKYMKAKNVKSNAQKTFVHFLTGKDKSTVFKKFDDPNLGYSKDGADLNFVKQQFENIGLSEVVRMIDNDMV